MVHIFLKEQRWKPLINKFMVDGLFEMWIKCMKIYDLIDQILAIDLVPSLLHGDMNKSNYGIVESNGIKEVYWFDAQCFYGDPLYDLQSFIQWFEPEEQIKIAKKYGHLTQNKNQEIIDPMSHRMLLYRAYIYLSCLDFFGPLNGRFKRQAVETMDLIISQYTESYPSLIIKDHLIEQKNMLIIHWIKNQ